MKPEFNMATYMTQDHKWIHKHFEELVSIINNVKNKWLLLGE